MALKYDGLFVTDMKECGKDMVYEGETANEQLPKNLSKPWAAMRAADVPEATAYFTTSWVHETDEKTLWVHEHDHEYDEILMFLGNDPHDVNSLGAEVFMTIEGEEHVLNTTSSVFIPAGTKHCPLGFYSVDRPFRFIAAALSGTGRYMP